LRGAIRCEGRLALGVYGTGFQTQPQERKR
jgi:hypothetical protein